MGSKRCSGGRVRRVEEQVNYFEKVKHLFLEKSEALVSWKKWSICFLKKVKHWFPEKSAAFLSYNCLLRYLASSVIVEELEKARQEASARAGKHHNLKLPFWSWPRLTGLKVSGFHLLTEGKCRATRAVNKTKFSKKLIWPFARGTGACSQANSWGKTGAETNSCLITAGILSSCLHTPGILDKYSHSRYFGQVFTFEGIFWYLNMIHKSHFILHFSFCKG